MSGTDTLNLSVHHIGGRAGTRCFPILPFFEHDLINVLYEADRSSLAGIRAATDPLPSKTIILADCLSGEAGPRPFHLYSNRCLSSLYPILPEHADSYAFDAQFGWDNDPDGGSLVETLILDTVTLDQVIAREAGAVPPPNFLSLDTQGSELEILRGSPDCLAGHVVAVMTEVEFIPLYQDQPLFGDIVAWLAEQGFELASLEIFPTSGASDASGRTPIGLRGKGYPQGGEALFLRRPESLAGVPERDRAALLLKLAFIAFVFGYFDRTHAIVSTLPDNAKTLLAEADKSGLAYLLFLKNYAEILGSYPSLYPVGYSEIFPPAASAKRFMTGMASVNYEQILSGWLNGRGHDAAIADLSKLLPDDFIGIEVLANQFHLTEQAEALRENRRAQVDSLLKWLRMERTPSPSGDT